MIFSEIRKGLEASERNTRRLAQGRRLLAKYDRIGQPPLTPLRELGDKLREEMSVLGHQLLLILLIAVVNIVFFGLLIFVLPYAWDWFWSFP